MSEHDIVHVAARVTIAVLGVGCSGTAILIAVNFRSWASRLIEGGQLLASRRWGFLFRGEYSRPLVFIMAVGLLGIGLDGFAGIGVPGADRLAPQFFWIFAWLVIGFPIFVRLRSQSKQTIPPITMPIALILVAAHLSLVFAVTPMLSRGQ